MWPAALYLFRKDIPISVYSLRRRRFLRKNLLLRERERGRGKRDIRRRFKLSINVGPPAYPPLSIIVVWPRMPDSMLPTALVGLRYHTTIAHG